VRIGDRAGQRRRHIVGAVNRVADATGSASAKAPVWLQIMAVSRSIAVSRAACEGPERRMQQHQRASQQSAVGIVEVADTGKQTADDKDESPMQHMGPQPELDERVFIGGPPYGAHASTN